MQKTLFLIFFFCLSANVWAQNLNTKAVWLFAQSYKQKADSTIKTDGTPVIFYTESDNQGEFIQNAVVWDRKTQNIAIQNIKKSDFSTDTPHNYTRFVCIRLENDDNSEKIKFFLDKIGRYVKENDGIVPVEHFIWIKEWSDNAFTQDGKKGLVWVLESSITDMPKKQLLTLQKQKSDELLITDNTALKFTWLDKSLN